VSFGGSRVLVFPREKNGGSRGQRIQRVIEYGRFGKWGHKNVWMKLVLSSPACSAGERRHEASREASGGSRRLEKTGY
jgi:hypothetical protein